MGLTRMQQEICNNFFFSIYCNLQPCIDETITNSVELLCVSNLHSYITNNNEHKLMNKQQFWSILILQHHKTDCYVFHRIGRHSVNFSVLFCNRALTIGQMQGKFQMVVVRHTGHAIQVHINCIFSCVVFPIYIYILNCNF